MSDTIEFRNKTPIKTDVKTMIAIFVATITITSSVCYKLNSIQGDLQSFHSDCQRNYESSWHIDDQVEYEEQTRNNNGHPPDVSDVLHKTRK